MGPAHRRTTRWECAGAESSTGRVDPAEDANSNRGTFGCDGADGSGIATSDVYVPTDGGPFAAGPTTHP